MDVKNFTEENIVQIKNYIKSKTNVINESISWVDNHLKYEDKNFVLLKLKSAQNKLKKRPLLQNIEEAIKLYDSRVKEYEKVAKIVVDVEKKDIKDIIKEILGKI